MQLPLFKEDKTAGGAETVVAPEPRRKPWAWLLRHVFEIDVTNCPRCGGVTAKHGLGPRPPPKPPPKGQLRLAFPLA